MSRLCSSCRSVVGAIRIMASLTSYPVGIVGGSNIQQSRLFDSQQSINCYPLHDTVKDKWMLTRYAGSMRLGQFPTSSSAFTGRPGGFLKLDSLAFAVLGDNVFTISPSLGLTSVGTIGTNSGPVSMASGGDYVMIVDGTGGWLYQISTGLFNQITVINFPNSTGFPTSPTCVVEQQGFFLVNNNGTQSLFQSAPDDPTQWDVLNELQINYRSASSAYPLISMRSVNGRIFCFTSGFIEVLENDGKAGFTFSQDQNLIFGYGAINDQSTAQGVGGMKGQQQPEFIIFISLTPDGTKKVMMTSGNPPEVVSTASIDYRLNQLVNSSDAIAYVWTENGQTFWVCSFTQDNLTLAYNVTNDTWIDLQTGNANRYFVEAFGFFNGYQLALSYLDNFLYQLGEEFVTDSGTVIPFIRVTPNIRFEQYRKMTCKYLDVYVEQGNALSGVPILGALDYVFGSDPFVYLFVSYDGGRTFVEPMERRMGRIGEYTFWTRFENLGTSYDWTFKFVIKQPIPLYIMDAFARLNVSETSK
jgi:hypothetical protein